MRHRVKRNKRLGTKPKHSDMMIRNLATSFLLYEKIRTTKKRAKVIQPVVDRLITYAKNNEPQVAIRYINKVVTDVNACKKIMEVYVDRFKERPSGLTSAKPLGARVGDGAELVELSFVV